MLSRGSFREPGGVDGDDDVLAGLVHEDGGDGARVRDSVRGGDLTRIAVPRRVHSHATGSHPRRCLRVAQSETTRAVSGPASFLNRDSSIRERRSFVQSLFKFEQ